MTVGNIQPSSKTKRSLSFMKAVHPVSVMFSIISFKFMLSKARSLGLPFSCLQEAGNMIQKMRSLKEVSEGLCA